ncbi:hypothetical protein HanOQP8_Chr14g0508321 [Helianthus annuus]|nr:hypothetical protein HanOQP8_Chr14g0508321 [Helianthus annuus]
MSHFVRNGQLVHFVRNGLSISCEMVPSYTFLVFLKLRDLIYHYGYKTRYKTKSTDICTNRLPLGC